MPAGKDNKMTGKFTSAFCFAQRASLLFCMGWFSGMILVPIGLAGCSKKKDGLKEDGLKEVTLRPPNSKKDNESNLKLILHYGGSDLDIGQAAGASGAAISDKEAKNRGVLILVNWDDDDADGVVNDDGDLVSPFVPDLEESPVANEDNLAQLEIVVSSLPLPHTGIVRLNVTGSGIRLWDSPTKNNPVTQLQWNLEIQDDRDALQSIIDEGKLWCEATTVSTSVGDVTFELSYEPSGLGGR